MIDEKKIEEAAEKYSGKEYIKDSCRTAFEDGFFEGVYWFKENLWHDAKEEPQQIIKDNEFVDCLVKFKDGIIEYCTYNTWQHWWEVGIDNNRFLEKISSWCYIDDLIK